jgi:hypothetical protein
MVMQAASWAEELGALAVVAGDFNVHDGFDGWAPVLAAAGWRDLGAAAGAPTCQPSRGPPSRVDRVLASPALSACCGPLQVDWSLGLPVHAALRVPLALPRGRAVLRCRPGVRLDAPDPPDWADRGPAADAAARARWELRGPPLIDRGDLRGAWAVLDQATTELLAARAGVTPGPRRRVRLERQVPPTGRAGEALDRASAAALRRARRLRALASAWPPGPGPLPQRCLEVLRAAARADQDCPTWGPRLRSIASAAAAAEAAAQAEAAAGEAAARARRGRRERWRGFVHAELAAGGRRVFGWLRGELSEAPAPTARPDGTLTGDLGEAAALVQGAWSALWCPAVVASPCSSFEAGLGELPPSPPSPR